MPPHQPDPARVERLAAALAQTFPQRSPSEAGVSGPLAGWAAGRPSPATNGDLPDGAGRFAIEVVRAPGRVNLIGDHTDYNDGFVMPVAIHLDCWLAFRRRADGLVRIVSDQLAGGGVFRIDDVAPPVWAGIDGEGRAPSWLDRVAAIAWSVRESGLSVCGLDAIVDSNVPIGIGLGSSTALEVACAVAFAGADRIVAAPVLASLAYRAEREYVGVEAGIKDQFASAAGREGKALLLDCRSLETKLVAIPPGLRVVVCDSGSRMARDHATFRERRAECSRAVALLSERIVGLCSLRDLDAVSLKRHRSRLPEPLARRAEHVIAENARVLDAAVALATNDLDEVARLFAESHASLRDLYEVGSANVEALMGIASTVPGVVASRMTGPGLGGCTVHLVLEDAIPAFAAAVERRYAALTGLEPHVYPLATVDGAGRLLARP